MAATSPVLAAVAALLFGLSYGLCLVCGLSQAERMAGEGDRGAVVACYYVLTYLGFVMPFAVDGLNAALGRPGAFAALAGGAAVLTGWMGVRAARARTASAHQYPERSRAFSRTSA